MKTSKFTDNQIIDTLKWAEADITVPTLCREVGINSATFYTWRAKSGGMDVSLMVRMKELEAENARLRKMYVEEKLKAENGGVPSSAPSWREREGLFNHHIVHGSNRRHQ